MENSVPSFAPQPRETPQGHGMSDANSERVFVQGRLGPSKPPSLPTAGCRRLTHLGSEHSSGKALKDLLRSRHLDACTHARTHTQNMRAHPEHMRTHMQNTRRTRAHTPRTHPAHVHTPRTHMHTCTHTCRTHTEHMCTHAEHTENAYMHRCTHAEHVCAHMHTHAEHTPQEFLFVVIQVTCFWNEKEVCVYFFPIDQTWTEASLLPLLPKSTPS